MIGSMTPGESQQPVRRTYESESSSHLTELEMGARKRASASTTTDATKLEPTTNGQCQTDPSIAPCKSGLILKLFLLLSMLYFYLIYKIESQLKKSILINAAVSLAGFFVTQKMIPVASTYVLRRNLFGFDINKKGTPQGTLKVPESLGIVVGIVFLVLAILFQYFITSQQTQIGLLSTMRP